MSDDELVEKLRWVREGHVLTEKYASPAADRIEALAARVTKLEEALTYYAEENRYSYDTDCAPEKNNPGIDDPEVDLLSDDRGRRARAALGEAE